MSIATLSRSTSELAEVATAAGGKRVGSTVNTMKVLAYMGERGQAANVTEIAKATDINLSTCFNIARTLMADGYLQWLPERKKYAVGPALSALAHRLTAKARDLESLRPAMQQIARTYALTITLWQRCSLHSMELIMVADSESAVRIQMPVGQRLPVLLGGMGRILALEGGLTDAQREAIFGGIVWGRALSLSSFMAQARQARRRGYGLDEGFTHRSVTAVAVAVPPARELVEDVCSATMFRDQHDDATLAALVADLSALAQSVADVKHRAGAP